MMKKKLKYNENNKIYVVCGLKGRTVVLEGLNMKEKNNSNVFTIF